MDGIYIVLVLVLVLVCGVRQGVKGIYFIACMSFGVGCRSVEVDEGRSSLLDVHGFVHKGTETRHAIFEIRQLDFGHKVRHFLHVSKKIPTSSSDHF